MADLWGILSEVHLKYPNLLAHLKCLTNPYNEIETF